MRIFYRLLNKEAVSEILNKLVHQILRRRGWKTPKPLRSCHWIGVGKSVLQNSRFITSHYPHTNFKTVSQIILLDHTNGSILCVMTESNLKYPWLWGYNNWQRLPSVSDSGVLSWKILQLAILFALKVIIKFPIGVFNFGLKSTFSIELQKWHR